jgi:hypothetical protein
MSGRVPLPVMRLRTEMVQGIRRLAEQLGYRPRGVHLHAIFAPASRLPYDLFALRSIPPWYNTLCNLV